jgi:hypothetical protein
MKRITVLLVAVLALAAAPMASAFHHIGLPSTACASDAAGSPSNDNGQAKEAISAHNPAQTLPLPPVGTPGQGQGEAGTENCANG